MRPCVLIAGWFVGIALSASAQGADWIRAQTDHFVVYSNVGKSATRQYLEQLEGFKLLSEMLLGANAASAPATARFTLYLLDDREALQVVRPELDRYVAGVYLHCVEGAQAYSYRPMTGLGEQDSGLIVLLHEYSHHVMYSRMRRFYPAWYVEGFADYLSTVTLRGDYYSVGVAPDQRVDMLTNDSSPWIEPAAMLDPKQFAVAVEAQRVNSLQFYAQAWLMTHYMLSDSDRVRGFNQYFEQIGQGADALPAFEAATGIAPAKLERLLRNHLRRLPGVRVKVPQLPDASVVMTELPKAQGDYLLQASVVRTCPGPDYGKQLLESLRAMKAAHASDARFRIELSRAELLFGDPQAARHEIEALARTDDADFDVFYLLGRSYYEEALHNPDQREALMTKASREFLTAYQMNKLNAPNLYFLSKSLDDSGETPGKAVLNASMGAVVLAPSVHVYAINAAIINLRAGNAQAAISVMQPFASDPHNPAGAARVTAMISAIREQKELGEIMSTLAGESADE